jgi:tellurite methyltransferase
MSWAQYFEKNKGRPLRPFYIKAIEYAKVFESTHPTAIDFGCGAGIETLDLLKRGWKVVAIDGEVESIQTVNELTKITGKTNLKTICRKFFWIK